MGLGRAAVSGLSGAQRRLERRRQLAMRPLAERQAGFPDGRRPDRRGSGGSRPAGGRDARDGRHGLGIRHHRHGVGARGDRAADRPVRHRGPRRSRNAAVRDGGMRAGHAARGFRSGAAAGPPGRGGVAGAGPSASAGGRAGVSRRPAGSSGVDVAGAHRRRRGCRARLSRLPGRARQGAGRCAAGGMAAPAMARARHGGLRAAARRGRHLSRLRRPLARRPVALSRH